MNLWGGLGKKFVCDNVPCCWCNCLAWCWYWRCTWRCGCGSWIFCVILWFYTIETIGCLMCFVWEIQMMTNWVNVRIFLLDTFMMMSWLPKLVTVIDLSYWLLMWFKCNLLFFFSASFDVLLWRPGESWSSKPGHCVMCSRITFPCPLCQLSNLETSRHAPQYP